MKAKVTCWMAKGPSGHLWTFTAARTRKDCIRQVLGNYRAGTTWRKVYRGGTRIVRVNCVEA